MIEITNECVDCGKPCLGRACPYRYVTRFYCDRCKEEVDVLYHYEDEECCAECVLADLEKVEVED